MAVHIHSAGRYAIMPKKNQVQENKSLRRCDIRHFFDTGIHRCIFILVLSILFLTVPASAVVQDTFESYTLGDLNGQGGWSAHSNFDVVSSPVQSGNKAVRTAAGPAPYASKSFAWSTYFGGYYRWDNYAWSTGYNIYLWDSSTLIVKARFTPNNGANSGKLQTWNGASWVDRVTGLSWVTWYKMTVNMTNSTSYNIYLNDVKLNTDPIMSLNATSTGYLNGVTLSTDENSNVGLDSLFYGNSTEMLISPADGEIINISFPPLSQTTNFWWGAISDSGWQVEIAKDYGFNLLVKDETILGNTTTASTLVGQTYYWRLTNLSDSEISGPYSFSVVGNTTATGTAIHGVIYEIVAGIYTPIDGASVYIQHSAANWSSQMVTGSNGYFIFPSLYNSTTYYLRATKSDLYQDSVTYYITTGTGTTSTQNILLEKCASSYDCYFGTVEQNIFFMYSNGTALKGYTVNIYKGDSATPTYTLVTDRDGAVAARLTSGELYRLEILSGGINMITDSEDQYFYPSDISLEIVVDNITWAEKTATVPTNMTNFTSVNGTWQGGLSGYNNTYLESVTGLGPLGQSVMVGILNWIIVGAGGPLTAIFTTSMLAWLGIVSWNMVFYFIITGVSLYIIMEMR